MTAQEFIKGCEHDGSFVPVKEVIRLMNEFGKLMCDKQKHLCFTHALPYKEGAFGNYFYRPNIKVDKNSILNSPYPDELKDS